VKLSVVLFDAGFREAFHTLDGLAAQTLARERFEVLWVEYFGNIAPAVLDRPWVRPIAMDAPPPWHIGKMVNQAARRATGDALVILDADVLVRPTFLESLAHRAQDDPRLVIHVPRRDQPAPDPSLPLTYDALDPACELSCKTNYGGCCLVRREHFAAVGGYTEHPDFREASAVAMEFHFRLMNLGLNHAWHDAETMLHPWHGGTGQSGREAERLARQQERIGKVVTRRIERAEEGTDARA
jgi:hypothetical protein